VHGPFLCLVVCNFFSSCETVYCVNLSNKLFVPHIAVNGSQPSLSGQEK